ncbi:hypothetical protein SEA_MARCIE_20 [Microbacterium phage Marcie]|nr:hypothetical protein SEA_MARCIE_20 [Microbacterium phage Marcie]
MIINPELAEHKAICHPSLWRALPSGPPAHEGGPHPRHYIRLRDQDIAELVATGGFTVPDDEIPDAVRAWRKTQEIALKIVEGGMVSADQIVHIGEHGPEAVVPLEATRV